MFPWCNCFFQEWETESVVLERVSIDFFSSHLLHFLLLFHGCIASLKMAIKRIFKAVIQIWFCGDTVDHLSMVSQFFETVNHYSHYVNCLILGNDEHSGHENTANDIINKHFASTSTTRITI